MFTSKLKPLFRIQTTCIFTLFVMSLFSISCTDTVTPTTELKPQQDHRRSDNPLADYVFTPDDSFSYEIAHESQHDGYKYFVLKMVSQEWLTKEELIDPVWWHWVSIVVPDGNTHKTGMLFISGGSRSSKLPTEPDEQILQIAHHTHSVVAKLHNVPNQPVVFHNDDFGPRKEDELIAYGWRKFLEAGGGDENGKWLARFPMTKAAVRTMDAITDLTLHQEDMATVTEFVVTGASKRGWTTWTTGAVDKRVVAIAPIVIDLLHLLPSFHHHWRAYGRWADAIHDYEDEGIMEWQDSEEYEDMARLVDPYSYISDLKLPKLILNATGDQFFLPDSWQFYWDQLEGEKHIRYVPNTDHGMRNSDVLESLVAFHQMVIHDRDRPQFDWKVTDGITSIQTHNGQQPVSIKLWTAHNPSARNFQLKEIGEAFTAQEIAINDEGSYTIQVETPQEGWTAYFVELTYPGVDSIPLKLTTGTVVLPDEYPYPVFESKNPMGSRN